MLWLNWNYFNKGALGSISKREGNTYWLKENESFVLYEYAAHHQKYALFSQL